MNRLDRYVARRHLANTAAILVALFAFVVAVDVFLNLKRFLRAAEGVDPDGSGVKVAATAALAVIDLWGPRLVQLFNHLGGLVVVIAAGFTASSMVRKRELVAAMASGVSLPRLAAPMLAVGVLVTGLQALNQEFLIPRVAHLLPRSATDVGRREMEPFAVTLLRDGSGRLWNATRFEPAESRLVDVTIWERDERGRVTRRISADEARWASGRWEFVSGFAERPGAPGALEPVTKIETDLEPTVILVRQVAGFGQSLSWRQINQSLANDATPVDDATRRRLDRIRFGRVAFMLSNICVLGLAIPFFMTRTPVNAAARSLRLAPIVAVGLIGSVVGVTSPLPGLPVALAVFFPPMVLGPLAVAALSSMKT